MSKGTIAGMIATGLSVLTAGGLSGFGGLMMWGLTVNGFMGQQRAVDTSMFTYIALAAAAVLLTTVLSLLAVYFLVVKRAWNAAGAAVLSIVIFSITTGILHIICVVISAVVANQMWNKR